MNATENMLNVNHEVSEDQMTPAVPMEGMEEDILADSSDNTLILLGVKPETEPTGTEPAVPSVVDEFESEIKDIASDIVKTMDYSTKLGEYVRIGDKTLSVARKQAKSIKSEYEAKDFKRLCERVTDAVRMTAPIEDVRVGLYVRMAVWVKAARALVPDVKNESGKVVRSVSQLSYYIVSNVLVSTAEFDVKELTGGIKKGWPEWVAETVLSLLSDDKPTTESVKESMRDHEKALQAERMARMDPDKAARLAEKQKQDKIVKERTAARNKVRKAISDLVSKHDEPASGVAYLAADVLRDRGLDTSGLVTTVIKPAPPDPATVTSDELIMLARRMIGLGRGAELATFYKWMQATFAAARAQSQAQSAATTTNSNPAESAAA